MKEKISNTQIYLNLFVILDDIEVKQDRIVEKDIELEENITLSMKYPNFNDVLKFEDNNLTETEKTFMLIGKCMESIETEEENVQRECAKASFWCTKKT